LCIFMVFSDIKRVWVNTTYGITCRHEIYIFPPLLKGGGRRITEVPPCHRNLANFPKLTFTVGVDVPDDPLYGQTPTKGRPLVALTNISQRMSQTKDLSPYFLRFFIYFSLNILPFRQGNFFVPNNFYHPTKTPPCPTKIPIHKATVFLSVGVYNWGKI